jgi:hypothetical protein
VWLSGDLHLHGERARRSRLVVHEGGEVIAGRSGLHLRARCAGRQPCPLQHVVIRHPSRQDQLRRETSTFCPSSPRVPQRHLDGGRVRRQCWRGGRMESSWS